MFKFPHTPHLEWLGRTAPRDDKVLSPAEVRSLLSAPVTVEEKVDGTNLGFSVESDGRVCVQSRGAYVAPGHQAQFGPLWAWLAARQSKLVEAIGKELILFGEWCFAVHSVRYNRLPDWFLAFDVYDRRKKRFWSTRRRDPWLSELGLDPVPVLARGLFTVEDIVTLLGPSRLTEGPMEGVYVRQEEGEWLKARAKVVRAEFVQAIDQHWTTRPLEKNRLVTGAEVG